MCSKNKFPNFSMLKEFTWVHCNLFFPLLAMIHTGVVYKCTNNKLNVENHYTAFKTMYLLTCFDYGGMKMQTMQTHLLFKYWPF